MNTEQLYKDYASTQDLNSQKSVKDPWSSYYFRDHFLGHLPKDRKANILDIGCGFGKYLIELKKLGYENTFGIDLSESQVEAAHKVHGLDNVMIAEPLDFLEGQEQQYDAILLIDILEHLDLEYCIELVKKVEASLKLGGTVLIHVPNGLSPMCPILYGDITHKRAYSVTSLQQLLRMGRFEEFDFFSLPPANTGLKSRVRKRLWEGLITPFIKGYMLIANGTTMGGIYTANILAVGRKK